MLFNSLQFLAFFPLVVLLYWLLSPRWRNPMLLIASYYFYMNWEPIYALLIFVSSISTWGCSKLMQGTHRRTWLTLCLLFNLGILFTYKYLGFVTVTINDLFTRLHIGMYVPTFELLLPVGISFYTFQAIGYIIDVYRGTVKPERSLMIYCLFVSFFPQLVAGPIERASNLLPQFHTEHKINGEDLWQGLRLMLWGYFMKLCVADNVSSYVDAVYNNIGMHSGLSIWVATFFFTFQIFCDFGGYSLIAIGTARCLGFRLMQNFRQPYLSHDVKDFWRRWHISLSSWLSDYIYKPLGGSRCSTARHQRNLMITFLVSGLWHGANWTFVLWGGYHGMLQVALSLKRKFMPRMSLRESNHRALRAIGMAGGIMVTFVLSMLGWMLFRANTIEDAHIALRFMLTQTGRLYEGDGKPEMLLSLLMIALLMAREIKNEYRPRLSLTGNSNPAISVISTVVLVIIIITCAQFSGGEFIYFQF